MRIIDEFLNHTIQHAVEYIIFFFGALIIVNIVYFFVFSIFCLFILIYIYFALKKFVKPLKVLLEYEANAEEEMFNVLLTVIEEAYKYRLLGKTEILEKKFMRISNELEKCRWHTEHSILRWFGSRQILLNALIVLIAYLLPTFLVLEIGLEVVDITILELALAVVWSKKFIYYFDHGLEYIVEIMRYELSFARILNFLSNTHGESKDGAQIMQEEYKNSIVIENINIELGGRKILKDFSFKIEKGKKLAVIGRHGSGKHTLFELILNNVDIKMGRTSVLKVLGYDYNLCFGREIREKVSYLSKNPMIYSGTVRENIDPKAEYTDDEIMKIFQILGAEDVIDETIDFTKSTKLRANIKKFKGAISSTLRLFVLKNMMNFPKKN